MKSWNVDDVMTKAVVSVDRAATYRSVVDLLIENRFSAVPVVDAFRRVTGVVSETDLLRKVEYAGDAEPRLFEGWRRRGERGKARARTAGDLMTAPAVVVLAGTSIAAAARRMDSEGVKRLPVVDDLGRLAGIVSRGDLLKVHLRTDDEIHADIETGILLPHLAESITSVAVTVAEGVVTFTGRVDRSSDAELVFGLTRQVAGVVDVKGSLSCEFEATDPLHPAAL
ncbi:CBS domain-containing protein [Actinoplanes sp. NPDC049118]|uniref:CBS domain-containing protein n=1 Tax=Actinoplanes sp. NPDC049118 TaxID=3155769 RepID=UPI0033E12FBB